MMGLFKSLRKITIQSDCIILTLRRAAERRASDSKAADPEFSLTSCADVVPLPEEKPATVITKLIITVTISSNVISASAALYFTNHSVQV